MDNPWWQEWFKNGQLHREGDKPAKIEWYSNTYTTYGSKKKEPYVMYGILHSEGDEPTLCKTIADNTKLSLEYHKKNKNKKVEKNRKQESIERLWSRKEANRKDPEPLVEKNGEEPEN